MAVMENRISDIQSDCDAEQDDSSQHCARPRRRMGEKEIQQRPEDAEGRDQADVAAQAGIANSARPAHLVRKKVPQTVGGQMCLDNNAGEQNLQSEIGQSFSEFIVVGEEIDDLAKPSNLFEIGPAKSEGGTEAEVKAAFELLCGENSCTEICADTQRFKLRSESALGDAAVETCDHAHAGIEQGRDDFLQVVALDKDVAVVDDQVFVTHGLKHLLEIADLHIGSEFIRADDQPDLAIGKFLLQLLNAGDRGIIWITDSEEDFECGIVLQTVATKTLIDIRIGSLQRFEN